MASSIVPHPTNKNFKDLTGRRFTRLVVLSYAGKGNREETRWNCLCDCGSELVVEGHSLGKGNSRSCGCLHRDAVTTHGMRDTSEYMVWQSMVQRCTNPNHIQWAYYGGRGISVYFAWQESFEAFYEHIGSRPSSDHSLDRIDNDGNYEPGNVRWATWRQQNNNTSRNVNISYGGETRTLTQWARKLGMPRTTLHGRLKFGWSVERAFTEPVAKRESRKR